MANAYQDEIEMPALGRKDFTVGSLFDCRNETLLSGIYFFIELVKIMAFLHFRFYISIPNVYKEFILTYISFFLMTISTETVEWRRFGRQKAASGTNNRYRVQSAGQR